ncbi:MAG: hypothetical protein HY744_13665 [Deltaproteobacteria bacterium]|nr:hypothetical protein [Deltaproteobacteria bacterium]
MCHYADAGPYRGDPGAAFCRTLAVAAPPGWVATARRVRLRRREVQPLAAAHVAARGPAQ